MAERNISNSALRTALINGDPFEYAHLVKFERPFASKNGDFRTNANSPICIGVSCLFIPPSLRLA